VKNILKQKFRAKKSINNLEKTQKKYTQFLIYMPEKNSSIPSCQATPSTPLAWLKATPSTPLIRASQGCRAAKFSLQSERGWNIIYLSRNLEMTEGKFS